MTSICCRFVIQQIDKSTAQATFSDILILPMTCNNNTPILWRILWNVCLICILNYPNDASTQNVGEFAYLCPTAGAPFRTIGVY